MRVLRLALSLNYREGAIYSLNIIRVAKHAKRRKLCYKPTSRAQTNELSFARQCWTSVDLGSAFYLLFKVW
jgi:hypothetical protein